MEFFWLFWPWNIVIVKYANAILFLITHFRSAQSHDSDAFYRFWRTFDWGIQKIGQGSSAETHTADQPYGKKV